MNFENKGVIYLITGPEPNHKYIGQTRMYRKNLDKYRYFDFIGRFKEHLAMARSIPTYHVDKIIKQYGPEKFNVKLITYCDISDIDKNEANYMNIYDTLYPHGLNIVHGNPHKNFNSEHTSTVLKQYYSDNIVKIKHSEKHRAKFKPIDANAIKKIIIKPIKENCVNKIVRMYIQLENTITRRRYGGKQEDFEHAYKRCIADAQILVTADKIVDMVNNTTVQVQNFGTIINAELRLHTMKQYKLVSLYITNDTVKKWFDKKRIVFGGKTIKLDDAFKNACDYIKKNKIDLSKITINTNLMATLPNCWNTLRA